MRPIFEGLFTLGAGELDQFHPSAHLLQTFTESGDILNFAPLMSTDSVFVTAGARDGCTPREGTLAFATALLRAGKIKISDTSVAFSQPGVPDFLGLTTLGGMLTSLQLLGQSLAPLPAQGNLTSTKTGVFALLPYFHDMNRTTAETGKFLSSVGAGTVPRIEAPPYNDGTGDSVCANRVE